MNAFRPLEGVRVVDLTSVVMGPLGTQILADMGADVVVIETPLGDANRHMGPGSHPDLSGVAMNLMRNKRSIVLDLASTDGREVLRRMVAAADVFVTNLRPGSRRRAGITFEDLRTVRPELVWVASAGFDPTSDRADDSAYDDLIQAATGLVDTNARAGLPPVISPNLIADKVAGMAIAQAVTAGLLHRATTGEGIEIVLAMYDLLRAFQLVEHGAAAIPEPAVGPSGYPRLLSPERRPLQTTDGLVVILAYERHHFEGLIRVGGRLEMLDDERFMSRIGRLQHIDELYREYQRTAAGFSTEEFLDRCRAEGVPAHVVVSLDDVVAGLPIVEHPKAGRYRVTPSLAPGADHTAPPHRPAPLLGEHGREVLAEIGYPPDEIERLIAGGTLGDYGSPS
jgi:crotonobetainyl-CoA:carnitine CoA-transferase CaiB-like acyl-CoA transferase